MNPEKHASNPILNSTSVSNVQAYPSDVILFEDTYYATVGSWPKTVGFRSSDGTDWEEVNSDLIPNDGSDSFDSYKRTAQVFRYTPDSGTYHILYKGIDDDGVHRFGHMSSDRPLQGYTKTDSNPVLTSEMAEDLSRVSDVHRIFVSDVLVEDGETIFFGGGSEAGTGMTFVWMGKGELGGTIRPETVLFTENDDELRVRSDLDPVSQPNVGAPTVIEVDDGYLMAYSSLTEVNDHEHASAQGKIYAAVGDRLETISPTNDLLLDIGDCNAWDELRVYQPRWLKRQDGEFKRPAVDGGRIKLHYSGHDCGASKFFGNRGVTGVAEYPLSAIEEFVAAETA